MNIRRLFIVALGFALLGLARTASAATEIKGAAILDHPCGKVSVKHMGLVHTGKMADAVKLGTPEMQKQWNDMSADDRKTMAGMMKDISKSEADFSKEIKANGLLVVDGDKATLTVQKTTKDANGSGTETMTQRFAIDGATCLITR
jgi:hypothetical protein